MGLSAWASRSGVVLPHVPAECGPAYHLFFLLLPSLAEHEELMAS